MKKSVGPKNQEIGYKNLYIQPHIKYKIGYNYRKIIYKIIACLFLGGGITILVFTFLIKKTPPDNSRCDELTCDVDRDRYISLGVGIVCGILCLVISLILFFVK